MRKKMGNGIRKLNCWELKNCGRQPDGPLVRDMGLCPAATEESLDGMHDGTNSGRACWVVSGTMCGGEVQGTFARKFQTCKTCDFYLQVQKEEYPNFRLSAVLMSRMAERMKTLGTERKLNCWEFKNCGRQPDGPHVHDMGLCPAATEENLDGMHDGTNSGRTCWIVSGTMCGGKVQGTFAKKYENCQKCDFFNKVREEESPNFRLSASLLKKINTK